MVLQRRVFPVVLAVCCVVVLFFSAFTLHGSAEATLPFTAQELAKKMTEVLEDKVARLYYFGDTKDTEYSFSIAYDTDDTLYIAPLKNGKTMNIAIFFTQGDQFLAYDQKDSPCITSIYLTGNVTELSLFSGLMDTVIYVLNGGKYIDAVDTCNDIVSAFADKRSVTENGYDHTLNLKVQDKIFCQYLVSVSGK